MGIMVEAIGQRTGIGQYVFAEKPGWTGKVCELPDAMAMQLIGGQESLAENIRLFKLAVSDGSVTPPVSEPEPEATVNTPPVVVPNPAAPVVTPAPKVARKPRAKSKRK
jgi:hypothetical protein